MSTIIVVSLSMCRVFSVSHGVSRGFVIKVLTSHRTKEALNEWVWLGSDRDWFYRSPIGIYKTLAFRRRASADDMLRRWKVITAEVIRHEITTTTWCGQRRTDTMFWEEMLGFSVGSYWGQYLWARGYWVAKSENVTDEVWIEYIKNQKCLSRLMVST